MDGWMDGGGIGNCGVDFGIVLRLACGPAS